MLDTEPRRSGSGVPVSVQRDERNDLDIPRRLTQIEPCDRNGKPKTPRTGASGVHVAYTGAFCNARFVGMAADHHIELSGRRINGQLLNIMQNIDEPRSGLDNRRRG